MVSADPAHLRNLTVSRDFIHEETYQRLHYSLQSIVIATYVAEQRAYMAYVDNQLYRITLNGDVSLLQNKPVYDMGRSGTKIDDTDTLATIDIIPVALTDDNKAIVVTVRKGYRRDDKFQTVIYHTDNNQVAYYDPAYKVWTVRANGHLYVIEFAGDNVSDPDVIIVHAPSNINRPQVVVVPGSNGAPPAVVPAAPPKNHDGPPVVIPGAPSRDTQSQAAPNGGPAIVIPQRPMK